MAAQFTIWDKIRLTADMKETQLTNLAKFISHLIRYLDPVLRIRIRDPVLFHSWFRDPVLFWPLVPGSGFGIQDGKKFGSRILDVHPRLFFRELRNSC
jgi:hypothetical protein